MRIVWNERSVRWFTDASEYTGYNKKLASILLGHIPSRTTLCDMGCGAGLIDFELAHHFESITCIDINEYAVSAVKNSAQNRGIKNLTTICSDGAEAEGKWDTVIALFHGGGDLFERYYGMAREQLIIATNLKRRGDFGPKNRKAEKNFDAAGIAEHLRELGIKYHYEEHAIEYGQPFSDIADAKEFVRAYSMPMEEAELSAYLDKNLVLTGDERFPYYLPKTKKFGLFVIRRAENEK